MPFGFKNADISYHKLMDVVFLKHIGHNLEVYINDMIFKLSECKSHPTDLQDVLESFKKYNMHLNPAKCLFGVKVGKLLGFILTRRGIKANPDKFQAIIDMRIPFNVK